MLPSVAPPSYAYRKRYGRKVYFPFVRGQVRVRKPFRTATAALAYAQKLQARYESMKRAEKHDA